MRNERHPDNEPKKLGYDIAASVLRLRDELAENNGTVRPEIAERIYMEELSMVAEMLPCSHDVNYELERKDGKLCGPDGQGLLEILSNGTNHTSDMAHNNPKLQFWANRQHDFELEGHYLEEFADTASSDDVYVSISPYPEEAEEAYGADIFDEYGLGPNAERRTMFVYLYQKHPSGSLRQRVLMLEKSSKEDARDILAQYGVNLPEYELTDSYLKHSTVISASDITEQGDEIIARYDKLKYWQTGEATYMGRPDKGARIDAWDFLKKHKNAYLKHYEIMLDIAKQDKMQGDDLRRNVTELTAGFWAHLKEQLEHDRKEGFSKAEIAEVPSGVDFAGALTRAIIRGDQFNGGCASVSFSEKIYTMNTENIGATIFGQDPNLWQWKQGMCRTKNCGTKPEKTEVGPCYVCRGCQAIYDKGKDPQKVYASRVTNGNSQESKNAIIASLRFWFRGYS